MLRVLRRGDRHDPKDLTVGAALRGSRSTRWFRARRSRTWCTASCASRSMRRPRSSRSALAICAADPRAPSDDRPGPGRRRREQPWARLDAGGKPQGQAFTPAGVERRTAVVTRQRHARRPWRPASRTWSCCAPAASRPPCVARPTDEPRADGLQRLFIATLAARWVYTARRDRVRAVLAPACARRSSKRSPGTRARPIRATLDAIAEVVLASYQEISQVTLTVEERPYRPVDLLELAVDGDALFVALRRARAARWRSRSTEPARASL